MRGFKDAERAFRCLGHSVLRIAHPFRRALVARSLWSFAWDTCLDMGLRDLLLLVWKANGLCCLGLNKPFVSY